MKFVETVTSDWESHNKIDLKNYISCCIKNIRLVKPDGTPDCIKIRFSKHTNLNEDLYCEDFPVYRYFHGFKKIEHLPFALNKTGIYESIDIITESDSDFKGKLRYDVYEVYESNPKIPDEILISKYSTDKLDGKAVGFIRKNYKEESKQDQTEQEPESLALVVGEETHLLAYTRFIRKAITLCFFLYEIKEPELYMELSELNELPKNVFAFSIIKTQK